MPNVREFYEFIWENVPKERIEFEDKGLDSIFRARVSATKDNLDFLVSCQDEYIYETANYELLRAGHEFNLIREAKHKAQEGVFFNFKAPLLSLDFESVKQNSFYVADINFESSEFESGDENIPDQIQFLFYVSSAIQVLEETKDYQAGTNLIYFGRDTLKIPLSIHHDDFDSEYVEKVVSETNLTILQSFLEWFSSDDSQNHQGNKKAIFKLALFEVLIDKIEQERFSIFLSSLDKLAEKSMKSYELYLEDFNYSKFSEKLEEKRIEYFEKIAKVILDVRNQIIGLPIVFVLLNVARQNQSISGLILFGMLIYCLILLVILSQQLSYIDDIDEEIVKFTSQTTASDSMKSDLSTTRKKLRLRLKSQKQCIRLFQILTVLAGFVSIAQFFDFI